MGEKGKKSKEMEGWIEKQKLWTGKERRMDEMNEEIEEINKHRDRGCGWILTPCFTNT